MVNSDYPTLIGLVSQYSPSGQESGAAKWLIARMRALGYTNAFMDDAGNAIGIMGNGARQIILLGHIDTVPGEIPIRLEDGVLYGRGSVDAKGPLACFVDAVAQLGLVEEWQLVVIGAVEEERNSDGARFVVNQYQPEFAIIGEPNRWDRIALGYKGSAWTNVIVRQAQEHTASGEKTACESAIELWLEIKSYADSYNADKRRAFDKLLPTLRGMNSESSDFEQRAQLRVGVRLPKDVSPSDWYEKINRILKAPETFRVFLEPTGFAIPAWECEKNTPPVRAFLNGIRLQGGEPRFVYKTGTADLNIVAPIWKCPTLVYGPGDSNLDHTPNEHIEVEEYSKAVNVLCGGLRYLMEQ
jgi:LysW-gamma-L-lysine carboxypeptidase